MPGSNGSTSNSCCRSTPLAGGAASASPIASPIATSMPPLCNTMVTTCPREAPSAMRMPISGVRLRHEMRKDRIQTPITDRHNATPAKITVSIAISCCVPSVEATTLSSVAKNEAACVESVRDTARPITACSVAGSFVVFAITAMPGRASCAAGKVARFIGNRHVEAGALDVMHDADDFDLACPVRHQQHLTDRGLAGERVTRERSVDHADRLRCPAIPLIEPASLRHRNLQGGRSRYG